MDVQNAIAQFVEHVRASQSAGTATTYANGLKRFTTYLSVTGISPTTDVRDLSVPLLTGFVTWLYSYLLDEVANGDPQRISESTKGTYYAAISRFLEYLVIETQLLPLTLDEYDTVRKVLAKGSKRQSRTELPPDKLPSQQIIHDLLDEVRRPLELPERTTPETRRRLELIRLRDIAMIDALLSSGMRVSELVRLRRGNLLHEVRGATVRYSKGKKDREVLFSDGAWDSIQTYLSARADGASRGEAPRAVAQIRALADLPVFARHDRRAGDQVLPLTTRGVQQIFMQLSARAGIIEKFQLTPHTLRHFFATEFLSETGNLALTQYALGHSSPNTTRIYAQTKREDYRRAHREVFRHKE